MELLRGGRCANDHHITRPLRLEEGRKSALDESAPDLATCGRRAQRFFSFLFITSPSGSQRTTYVAAPTWAQHQDIRRKRQQQVRCLDRSQLQQSICRCLCSIAWSPCTEQLPRILSPRAQNQREICCVHNAVSVDIGRTNFAFTGHQEKTVIRYTWPTGVTVY